MSKRGVWQLQKLVYCYCDRGGSSVGAREVVADKIIQFAQENPQINFYTFVRRGAHPFIEGEYKSGRKMSQTIKNMTPDEILARLYEMRNQFGDKAKKIGIGKITKRDSIQGKWNPLLFKQTASTVNLE